MTSRYSIEAHCCLLTLAASFGPLSGLKCSDSAARTPP